QYEVNISQRFSCGTVNENELGQVYEKKGGKKVAVYSKFSNAGDLLSLIENRRNVRLKPEQINTIIWDILIGVKHFHDQGFVHQDLKLRNILLSGNNLHGYRAKLTDFGLSCEQNSDEFMPLATYNYESPEIFYFHSHPSSANYRYYTKETHFPSLASQYIKEGYLSDCHRKIFSKADMANDMWALGVIIYQLRYGAMPCFETCGPRIENDVLLKNLLTPYRSRRANIDFAIELFKFSQSPMLLGLPQKSFVNAILNPPNHAVQNICHGYNTYMIRSNMQHTYNTSNNVYHNNSQYNIHNTQNYNTHDSYNVYGKSKRITINRGHIYT
ncbi:MAG TPA: protein kinase, partial [Candidatus Berkiella sp.]|nr:protein kinase [Candidatus Berkiella sp.]